MKLDRLEAFDEARANRRHASPAGSEREPRSVNMMGVLIWAAIFWFVVGTALLLSGVGMAQSIFFAWLFSVSSVILMPLALVKVRDALASRR